MLSSTLFVTFTQPVAYVLIFVVVATAVMQVRYVNRALQRFNSTQVIPIQFVMFTLSVIIGSAVLYRDFKRTTAEQVVKFVGGCLLTFFGVFLITSGRPPSEDSEIEDLEEAQRRAAAEEEIIGLQEHGPVISHKPSHQQYQAHGTRRDSSAESATGTSSSRRSSRASRVNFVDAFARPLGIIASGVGHGGVPSSRIPPAPGPKIASVPSSLIENPWATDVEDEASHVGSTLQSPPTSSVAQSEAASSVPATPLSQASGVFASGQQRETYTHRPTTSSAARQHTHQHHRDASSSPSAGHRLFTAGGGAPIISPSPLSSTVTAVVHDTLRRGDAAAADRDRTNRRASVRRARPGLRESLFVPYSDDDDLLLAGESAVAGADRSVAPSADSVTRVASLPGESGAQQSPGSASHAPPPRASFRARAASVGSTLGDFFRSRRRRRGTLLERGGGAAATADADEANESTALLGSSVRGGGSRRVRGRG